jgi:predicted ATP-dependent Lon-type protease
MEHNGMSRTKKEIVIYLYKNTAATTRAPRGGMVTAARRKAPLRSEILGLVPMKNVVLRDATHLYSHIHVITVNHVRFITTPLTDPTRVQKPI